MDNLTHREEVNLHEAIQKSFPKILIKDLTEHERICPGLQWSWNENCR